jgi:hypothetical protein
VAGVAPHRLRVCQGHMAGGSLLLGDDEIFSAWEGHCEDVLSLKSAIVTWDRQIFHG